MNPRLARLQPYPFDKLRTLLAGVTPNPALRALDLSIGEPKHPTPTLVKDALAGALEGLAGYPRTAGLPELREAIAGWAKRRYGLEALDPATQVLPVNGSREALFAFAQTVIDGSRPNPLVACPNPFYQIYEGAALLAGARPVFLNATAGTEHRMDYAALPEETWKDVQLLYACSPSNPSGRALALADWKRLFELSDRHGFVIASDECYSEIYCDEANPPLGALDAATRLGRRDFRRLVMFSSLSKRSNAPGMRSGFVAGDAALLKDFLLYRTYHGSAMALPVQQASIAAWRDEAHVLENRRLYARKYDDALRIVPPAMAPYRPDGGFYLWLKTPGEDTEFCRELLRAYNVLVLPGSYLARESQGVNPGRGYVRAALVPAPADCAEALGRIKQFYEER